MTAVLQDPGHDEFTRPSGALAPLTGLARASQQGLLCELDSAVDFADHCRHLAGDEVAAQATELSRLAEALYERTAEAMRRHR